MSDDRDGPPVEQATGALHASSSLEHTRALFDHAMTRSPSSRIEVYRRSATRVRVSRGEIESGTDEGVAIRLLDPAGLRGFAASSGGDAPTVEWVLASAERHASGPPASEVAWAQGLTLRDQDASSGEPTIERLTAWAQSHPQCSWVESAATVETWVASGGLEAERIRCRAWCSSRDVISAARSLEGLDGALDGKYPERHPFERRRLRAASIVLSPEPAAQLVAALTRILHHNPRMQGTRVGEGWILHDDPTLPGSILGGSFDDAGFASSRVELADGRVVAGTLPAAGSYRRGSFRDRPASFAAGLVLTPKPVPAPSNALWVDELHVHPLDEHEWVLEARGFADTLFLRVQPASLAERCVGGLGAARATSKGVVTPSLVFEGLHPVD